MEHLRRPSLSAVGQSVKTAAFAAAVVLAAGLIPGPEARAIVASAGVAILVIYVWAAGRHSRRARHALDSLIAMSTDLARAGDPNTVGDRMAAHLARAVKVDQCGICYWDEVSGQVITMGYYPPERRDPVNNSYLLADYPECERALPEQVSVVLDLDDPKLPAPEREYIESIGGQVLAVVPLVVAGTTTGLVELTVERATDFDADRLRLASTMATEAGIMLENSRLVEQLRHRAFHDPLTGLPNRALFRDRVTHALDRLARDPEARCAVLFLDLDDFKRINDLLGHERGDDVLQTVAERLEAGLRPGDTAARLGGDEFTILLEERDRPGRGQGRWPNASHSASGGRSARATSRSSSGSASASPCHRRRAARSTSCSRTQTRRCTSRRPPARAASRSTTAACGSARPSEQEHGVPEGLIRRARRGA